MENTSGQGSLAAVPPEIDRWNWGAFLLNWIWGIGNNTFIALLMFVPVANLIMPFVLGAKGSAWAWRNKHWEDVAQFKRVQRTWARWAVVAYVLLALFLTGTFFGITALMKQSGAYQLAYAKVAGNPDAMTMLGPPISTGMVQGAIRVSGPVGKADISFRVEGRRAKGTVYLDAIKDMGKWRANRIELAIDGRGERLDLNR